MKTSRRRRARPALEVLEDRSVPATFHVTTLADLGGGSLYDCIGAANASAGNDTIVFDVQGTININKALPAITGGLTISGPGADAVRLQHATGGGTESLLRVLHSSLTVKGLTLANAAAGIEAADGSTLIVSGCTLEGFDTGNGPVILLDGGSGNISGSTFRDNTGWGVIHNHGGTLIVSSSTFHGNATGDGGCVFTESSPSSPAGTRLANCTFTGNSSPAAVVACLASGDNALVTANFCTFAGNSSFAVSAEGDGAILNLRGSLLAGNASGGFRTVGAGLINSLGNNVSGEAGPSVLNQAGDVNGATVLLGPLGDNGGPVWTMALLPGSAGLDLAGPSPLTTDARGVARPQGAGPDAGAFEAAFELAPAAGDGQAAQAGTAFAAPLRARLTEGGRPVQGAVVTFTAPPGVLFADGTASSLAVTGADGIATSDVLIAGDTPGGFTVLADTIGVHGAFTVLATNSAPTITSLSLSPAGSVPEGQTLTLDGVFTDDGDGRAHTLSVDWGDGVTDSVQIPVGQTTFSITHAYTAAAGLPADAPASLPILVSVNDASGALGSERTRVAVTDNVPAADAGGDLFLNVGNGFTRVGSFSYEGDNAFTAEVNYGDGGGWEPLALGPGRTFELSHSYAVEGSYSVRVRVNDGRGTPGEAGFSADVMLPGVTEATKGYIGAAGGSVTVSVTGGSATLYKAPGGGTSAIILARVPHAVADGQDGVTTGGDRAIGAAFDVRALNVGPDDVAIIELEYTGDGTGLPTVTYFDRAQGREILVPPSSFTVDTAAHKIYLRLDGRSTPALSSLSGTVFTITIPIPAASAPSATAPAPLSSPGFQMEGHAARAALAAVTTMIDPGVGAQAAGPGGGALSRVRGGTDSEAEESTASSTTEPKEEGLRRVRLAGLGLATDDLPGAPEADVTLPAAALTAPEPRRVEIGQKAPARGPEEEEEECAAEEALPCDDLFAAKGEEACPALAMLMLAGLAGLAACPRRRDDVWAEVAGTGIPW